jgi:hypothetical protein
MFRRVGYLVGATASLAAMASCGGDHLTASETRDAINSTPYKIKYLDPHYDGPGEIVAARATDAQGTSVRFAIALEGAELDERTKSALPGPGWGSKLNFGDWSGAVGDDGPGSYRLFLQVEDKICDAWQGKKCDIF